jgi:hypothetical protein
VLLLISLVERGNKPLHKNINNIEMTELEIAKSMTDLVMYQKETFNLIWGAAVTIGGILATTIGVLFKMYIDANNKRADNEKEHLKSLEAFVSRIGDLNGTLRETNIIAQKSLELINNPIIPTLNNIENQRAVKK